MSVESVITENLDIWTSAINRKSASGRGSSNKLELYGIKKLRELILELAVRGKLVPQNSNDEPAIEMLPRLKIEKEEIAKAGKFSSLKSSKPQITKKPFLTPESWSWCYLDDIVAIARGGSPRPIKSYITEEKDGLNWIKIGDSVRGSRYIYSTEQKIRKEGLSKTREVFPEDLILSNSMSFGFPYIMKIHGCIHDGWLVIRTPKVGVDKLFLSLLFQSPYARSAFTEAASGAVVQNLNADKVRLLKVALPPKEEQERIVVKFDELMTFCDQLESQTEASIEAHKTLVETLLSTLTNAKDADELNESWERISEHFDTLFTTEDSIDQLKQTILQLAVMGKLVKQDPNDEPTSNLLKRMVGEEVYKARSKNMSHTIAKEHISFELPSGWSFCNIEQLLDGSRKGMITGPFGSALKKSEHKESGIPVWGIESVKKGKFTGINKIFVDGEKAKELSSFKAIQGDLIISRSGTIDEICVIPDGVEDGLISTNLLRVTLDKELIEPEFFCFTFKGSEIVLDKIKDMCAGTTRLFLNQKILKSITFPVPPLCEQKKIICKVEELFSVCEEVKAKVRKANDLQNFLADSISSSFLN